MLLLTPLLLVLILADDGPAKPAAAPPLADQVKQVARDYDAAVRAVHQAAAKVPRDERAKLLSKTYPDYADYAKRMIELAEPNPRDPAGRDALLWALSQLTRGDESRYPATFSRAVDLLVEHHADDPEVARIGLEMHNIVSRRRDAFLEGIYANAEGHEAKGLARLALAQYLERKAQYVANVQKGNKRTYSFRTADAEGRPIVETRRWSNEVVAYREGLRLFDPDALRREAERLYRELIDEYGDVPYLTPGRKWREEQARARPPESFAEPRYREMAEQKARVLAGPKQSLAQAAAERLAAMERPTVVERGAAKPEVGQPAPDIDGIGLDGKPLKLSDYRGKVVALVFWGSWCAPCLAEVPHERALVERLKGKPFALLGVACDETASALRAIETERMTWPHWKNHGISGRYQVLSYPTVVVIDARGVIRSMNARGDELDRLVDALLKEAGPNP